MRKTDCIDHGYRIGHATYSRLTQGSEGEFKVVWVRKTDMTCGVKDTSIQAFWTEKLGFRLGKQAAAVLDNLNIYGPGTRADLVKRCNLKINVICGRVNELEKAGCIEVAGKTTDATTNKLVELLRVKGDTANVQ